MNLYRIITILFCLVAVPALHAEDRPPAAIEQFKPQYPFEEFQKGVSGVATVEFIVGTDGRVSNVTVAKASQPDFGFAAAACISKWKFKPGIKNGKTVGTKLRLDFAFDHPKK
jgi:protein TonB